MQIKQWEDKNLAQFSYAILSDTERQIVLIDPSRNPKPYLEYAREMNAQIIGIIETHPHADFISGHLELSQLAGAAIYISSLVGAAYPHTGFDEGNTIDFGEVKLISMNTPGHSPDSISIILVEGGKQKAVFTGDTLFIGDCGRPDLREGAGKIKATRIELAKNMYHTLRNKFISLADDILVYPAHGAGTLCGKGLSEANSSTMGKEKKTNWSLQSMTEQEFVSSLLSDQPFIPAYFPFDVEINRKGASPFNASIEKIRMRTAIQNERDASMLDSSVIIVDARKESDYKEGHLPNSINLMEGKKFETWLGSIIKPGEPFYLAGESTAQLKELMERVAAIGYEEQIKEAFVLEYGSQKEPVLDVSKFKKNMEDYTIVDIRNNSERNEGRPFDNSILIPLPELRDRVKEIPVEKPIVVHCAGGYRSAAGSSIVKSALNGNVTVFDLSEAIKEFNS